MKVMESREDSFMNDLGSIAFQLRKLEMHHIESLREVFIYLEASMLSRPSSFDRLFLPSLILVLQCFGDGLLHSQELFFKTIKSIYQKSDRFRSLQLHELAIVVSKLGSFWTRPLTLELHGELLGEVERRLEEDKERGSYGQ